MLGGSSQRAFVLVSRRAVVQFDSLDRFVGGGRSSERDVVVGHGLLRVLKLENNFGEASRTSAKYG